MSPLRNTSIPLLFVSKLKTDLGYFFIKGLITMNNKCVHYICIVKWTWLSKNNVPYLGSSLMTLTWWWRFDLASVKHTRTSNGPCFRREGVISHVWFAHKNLLDNIENVILGRLLFLMGPRLCYLSLKLLNKQLFQLHDIDNHITPFIFSSRYIVNECHL